MQIIHDTLSNQSPFFSFRPFCFRHFSLSPFSFSSFFGFAVIFFRRFSIRRYSFRPYFVRLYHVEGLFEQTFLFSRIFSVRTKFRNYFLSLFFVVEVIFSLFFVSLFLLSRYTGGTCFNKYPDTIFFSSMQILPIGVTKHIVSILPRYQLFTFSFSFLKC